MDFKYKQIENIIVNALLRVVYRTMIIIAVGMLVTSVIISDRDDTDGQERSGLKLRTDHGTGCQYLETVRGGITPRMKGDTHVGCSNDY